MPKTLPNSPSAENSLPSLESAEVLLRDTPLYTKFSLKSESAKTKAKPLFFGFKFDGHCSKCKKSATFSVPAMQEPHDAWYYSCKADDRLRLITAECTRDAGHEQRFLLAFKGETVEKIGQDPSLADVALDESKQYKSVLNKQDSAELHRAIGLAAHGVGIGSFVYLRRVFERLVIGRFETFKDAEKWNDAQFKKLRMDERVGFLKEHLPEFLVENKKMYSVLSTGIHELDEETCLLFFPVLFKSIALILDEDKKIKEELELKSELASAISKFRQKNPDATLEE